MFIYIFFIQYKTFLKNFYRRSHICHYPATELQMRLDVNLLYGKEISRIEDTRDGLSNIIISAIIFCMEDILLETPLEFEFIIPRSNSMSTNSKMPEILIRLRKLDFENEIVNNCCRQCVTEAKIISQHTSLIDDSLHLSFSWLKNAEADYPLSVWYFTLRNLFINPALPPWFAPVLINRSFISSTISNNKSTGLSLQHGSGRTRGRRAYMEDIDFAFESVRVNGDRFVAAYGVLDGHGGSDCAQFAADELPAKIARYLRDGLNTPDAMFKAFVETDDLFLKTGSSTSGSTANILIYDPQLEYVFVANSGDTRAVLCRNGLSLDLSMDRKATDAEEIAAIARRGGFVRAGRVMGSLAVSRAFGDRQIKKIATGEKILTVDPEISFLEIDPNIDEFIVLATDGLWDVLSSQGVVDMVKEGIENITSKTTDPTANILSIVADQIANHAVKILSSADNVTVMIIKICSSSKSSVNKSQKAKITGDLHSKINPNSTRLPYAKNNKMDFESSIPQIENKISSFDSEKSDFPDRNVSSSKSFSNSSSFSNSMPTSSGMRGIQSPEAKSVIDKDILDFLLDDSNF